VYPYARRLAFSVNFGDSAEPFALLSSAGTTSDDDGIPHLPVLQQFDVQIPLSDHAVSAICRNGGQARPGMRAPPCEPPDLAQDALERVIAANMLWKAVAVQRLLDPCFSMSTLLTRHPYRLFRATVTNL
jgi:hypothetical protein